MLFLLICLRDTVAFVFRDSFGSPSSWRWLDAIIDVPAVESLEVYSATCQDPRERHLEYIFFPDRFSVTAIFKALNVTAWYFLYFFSAFEESTALGWFFCYSFCPSTVVLMINTELRRSEFRMINT